MRLKTILIVAFFTIGNIAQAQVNKGSFKGADYYLNCKTVVTFLSEIIFTDKTNYSNPFSFSEKRKGKPIEKFKENSRTEWRRQLSKERIAIFEENQMSSEKDKNRFGGLTFEIDIFSIIISVILTLGILAVPVILWLVVDTPNRVKKYINKIVKAKFGTGGEASSPEVEALKDEITSMKDEIKEIKDKSKSMEDKIENSNHKTDAPQNPLEIILIKPEQPEVEMETAETEEFFLSNPNSNGSFNESSASTFYRESASIYRFTRKIGSNKATFQIDEREESVKLALQFSNKNIDPVCDAENAFSQNATKIVTKRLGEAKLIGGKWKVQSKAEIRYEI